jgi:hypothetical protein
MRRNMIGWHNLGRCSVRAGSGSVNPGTAGQQAETRVDLLMHHPIHVVAEIMYAKDRKARAVR